MYYKSVLKLYKQKVCKSIVNKMLWNHEERKR